MFLALLVAVTPSCLWYPVHAYQDQQRGTLSHASRASLVQGQSTRADVLCELGEPDWADAGGARLVYWNHESSSALFVWLIVDEEVVVFGKNRFLALEFDEQGTLRALHEEDRSFTKNMDSPDRRPSEEEFADLFYTRAPQGKAPGRVESP